MIPLLFFFTLFQILFLPEAGLAVTEGDLEKDIREFAEIEKGFLYRGVQPSEQNLQKLKEFGIRTLINFRHEPQEIERERKQAEKLGLKYLSLPWRIQTQPSKPVMKDFLTAVQKKEDGPFFMHCRRGAERTGVADAIYRHYVQGLSKEMAWDKAMKGFSTRFYWRPFIWQRWQDFLKLLGKRDPAVQN